MRLPDPFDKIEHIVTVVGCQRSGTTLTGQLLGADPRALLIDEFDGLYPWFNAVLNGAYDGEVMSADLLVQAAIKYRPNDARFGFHGSRIKLAPHVKWLVLKAPNLTFDAAVVARVPIPVTVVYPVRDPRSVVASMIDLENIDFVGNQLRLLATRSALATRYQAALTRLADENEPTWIRQAILWQIKSARSKSFENEDLPVSVFRYEDLVENPTMVLAETREACGLGPDRAPPAHTVFVGYGPGATDRTRRVDTTSLFKWKATLTAVQQADVMSAASPLAGRFGYV